MKPVRDYTDGQWLLLLWAFVVGFLIVGITISTLVLVVSILGALGAAYTTYVYLRERIGRSATASIFGWQFTWPPRSGAPAERDAAHDTETNEGGNP